MKLARIREFKFGSKLVDEATQICNKLMGLNLDRIGQNRHEIDNVSKNSNFEHQVS